MQVKSVITMIFSDMPSIQVGTPHTADVIIKQLQVCADQDVSCVVDVVNTKNGVRWEKQILFPRKALSISVIDYNNTGLVAPDKSIMVVK